MRAFNYYLMATIWSLVFKQERMLLAACLVLFIKGKNIRTVVIHSTKWFVEWLNGACMQFLNLGKLYIILYRCPSQLSKSPQSRNVSVGTLVEFTCATKESEVTSLVISTLPSVPHHESISSDLPNGGRQYTLSFIVPSEHSNITVICTAVRIPDVNQTTAILMSQGKIDCCWV